MISISKLLLGSNYYGDLLRYRENVIGAQNGATQNLGPVVVWNATKACNLQCVHCYADAGSKRDEGELTTAEAKEFIAGLGRFRVPVLLFSGGEPLLREDIFELVDYCRLYRIRPTFSTNGTLITKAVAQKIKQADVGYVGISIDGLGADNDRFRGSRGAFEAALQGVRHCKEAGVRVGLRFTINSYNYQVVEDIFRLAEEEKIDRICFYHLVYSGRGSRMIDAEINKEKTRRVMDTIIEKTHQLHCDNCAKEILTVDNHADGVYLYLKMRQANPELADGIPTLLRINGGNRSGIAIGAVDHTGGVHPDQFTLNHTFGNVRERSFGDIWTDLSHPILAGLKNRKPLLKGRCVQCRWLEHCNGNFRARSEAVSGDFWESDPACYLKDDEIHSIV
jgi:putative heme d1 biosynthesis radical SAM protein NirJ1